jgi:hypothetical protein
MKCKTPSTDQNLEIIGYANGKWCVESGSPSNHLSTFECFILVEIDDNLLVGGEFNGSVLFDTLNVLANGAFVAGIGLGSLKGSVIRFTKK